MFCRALSLQVTFKNRDAGVLKSDSVIRIFWTILFDDLVKPLYLTQKPLFRSKTEIWNQNEVKINCLNIPGLPGESLISVYYLKGKKPWSLRTESRLSDSMRSWIQLSFKDYCAWMVKKYVKMQVLASIHANTVGYVLS